MIKVFSDRRFVTPGGRHVVMLYPFWGAPEEDPAAPLSGRFDAYLRLAPSLVSLTGVEAADLAVLPMPWEDVRKDRAARHLADDFVRYARDHGCRAALFFINDSTEHVPYDDVLIFRTSYYKSRAKPLELAQPSWNEDYLEKYFGGQLPLRQKAERPVVGFCGYAGPLAPTNGASPVTRPLKMRLRRLLTDTADRLGLRKTLAPRARALQVLWGSTRVDANFIIRDQFLGPAVIQKKAKTADVAARIRREFIDNMAGSDYIICSRGYGNYSRRFYESLSAGRIPIFVDTDCGLPFDFALDWKRYTVWVDGKDVDRVDEIVADFHADLSPDDFAEMQLRCRDVWKSMLSPEGFFGRLRTPLDYVNGLQTGAPARQPERV
ncbi:MAG: exostosin family protein [Chloroflexi bacterium]|nr:exostosin family protein [Chloroflexota bacterium]